MNNEHSERTRALIVDDVRLISHALTEMFDNLREALSNGTAAVCYYSELSRDVYQPFGEDFSNAFDLTIDRITESLDDLMTVVGEAETQATSASRDLAKRLG